MCGISGIYHFNNSKTVSEAELTKMRDTLVHRGPDGKANYISSDKKVGLSQRRLAIIDLSPGAACPMPNKNKNIWITYNGEIYNFKELRGELQKEGHSFRTQGDTEVILYGYEEWGEEIVEKLNGMFAFVIWDKRKKILFAARDRLGIKPFYYSIQNGTFYFGSEIKAILAHPDFKKDLNEEGISHYLTFGSTPAPFTLFKDVKKLPAGHHLIIKNGTVVEKEYWNPAVNSKAQSANSENEYIEKVREILRDSIRAQMVSDVPFGCFLSGGIDSSTNAALMTEALGRPVETFSVGIENLNKYNELEYSRKLAKFIGTKPHEIIIGEKHLEEFLLKFPYHFDDPNSDHVALPLFWLSKLTRDNGVIVIQIGEGSDEIFAGYEQYLRALKLYRSWWQWLQKLPNFAKNGLFQISQVSNNPKFNLHKEYLRRLAHNQEFFWGIAVAWNDYQKEKLLAKPLPAAYPALESFYDEIDKADVGADFLKRLTYLEIKHRLPEFLLERADRMTMAHSIEGRVPFLDHRLVELALQIPTKLKLKNNTTKYILKKAVRGIIPDEIVWRKKQGFGTPISEWLKSDSKISNELTQIIFNSKIKKLNLFNYDYIRAIIETHRQGKIDNSFKIWNLIALSLWYDYWF